jgi:hypothetical protein
MQARNTRLLQSTQAVVQHHTSLPQYAHSPYADLPCYPHLWHQLTIRSTRAVENTSCGKAQTSGRVVGDSANVLSNLDLATAGKANNQLPNAMLPAAEGSRTASKSQGDVVPINCCKANFRRG